MSLLASWNDPMRRKWCAECQSDTHDYPDCVPIDYGPRDPADRDFPIQDVDFTPYHRGDEDPIICGHPASQWLEWFLALARKNAPGLYEGTDTYYAIPLEKCGSQGLTKGGLDRIRAHINPKALDLYIAVTNGKLYTRPRAQHRKPEWL